jgi:hypothetical protein
MWLAPFHLSQKKMRISNAHERARLLEAENVDGKESRCCWQSGIRFVSLPLFSLPHSLPEGNYVTSLGTGSGLDENLIWWPGF